MWLFLLIPEGGRTHEFQRVRVVCVVKKNKKLKCLIFLLHTASVLCKNHKVTPSLVQQRHLLALLVMKTFQERSCLSP